MEVATEVVDFASRLLAFIRRRKAFEEEEFLDDDTFKYVTEEEEGDSSDKDEDEDEEDEDGCMVSNTPNQYNNALND